VETGTHQELIQRNGHYARLYQLGLGALDAPEAG
jgi:ABC-type multidrug transport system fused ATPase/permease subunit